MKSRASLLTWCLAVAALGGALTAAHELPLRVSPPPLGAPATQRWSVTHALATKCGCSKRVWAHLVKRGARSDVRERVLLVDATGEWQSALETAGFDVVPLEAGALRSEFGIEAAPLLVIRRPTGALAYSGAYAEKRSAPPRDEELISRAMQGEQLDALPLFGCAVSRELQERADPLNLKYGAWK
jgi:hypothetical protein